MTALIKLTLSNFETKCGSVRKFNGERDQYDIGSTLQHRFYYER